ncbi:MAG: 50S ribosomal protein L4 [Candidatus Taylorbacteria bacterium RIFOXYD2_FULL_36_9]|uniref:Large ribosomal subunit protein uL4 n=1 Tax=Candidatus Taylorbacteria bacterium RIFOXYD2_FULL_36_9 TaxID=1802338 RepID=A0A1G2PGG2_9BACT|nr:MAG: 50S ribosomal protein L4 [Candidatus Taylorbacteria bacterium RIFOXYD2_FULL_36_9]
MKKTTTKKILKTLGALEALVYNQDGNEVETIKLPESIFSLPWKADLVHQVVISLMSNKRTNLAHTKTRGEVSGGGKKPWQQKGLGRARHGSTRSPIWVGGGVAHGPRNEKNYDRKVNKKMKAKALFTIMSRKFRDNEVFFLDSLKALSPKTKEALSVLKSLSKIKGAEQVLNKRANSAYIIVSKKDVNLDRGFRNFGNIKLDEFRNINPLDVLNYKYLIMDNPAEVFKFLENKMKPFEKISGQVK